MLGAGQWFVVNSRRLAGEVILLHLLIWWYMRVLWAAGVLPPFLAWPSMTTPAPLWWGLRFVIRILALLLVIGWAYWRKVGVAGIGLGGGRFWHNFIIALPMGMVPSGVFLGAVMLVTRHFGDSHPVEFLPVWFRLLIIPFSALDVLLQQVSTFGLLESILGRRLHWPFGIACGLPWISFVIAHYFIAAPIVFPVAALGGVLFCWLLRRTGNLGASLGVHFGYYVMLAVIGSI